MKMHLQHGAIVICISFTGNVFIIVLKIFNGSYYNSVKRLQVGTEAGLIHSLLVSTGSGNQN